jgi:hypothetical protein
MVNTLPVDAVVTVCAVPFVAAVVVPEYKLTCLVLTLLLFELLT